ncbi:MAG: ECF-type sigma factor [Gemmatimonadota bacterium]
MTPLRQPVPEPDAERTDPLFDRFGEDDRAALDRTADLLYLELLRLARAQRARWQGDETLGTTALCHEAYLKLAGVQASDWRSRAHFLSVAARAMRQILIDYSRARRTGKRGGECAHLSLEDVEALLPSGWSAEEDRWDALLTLEEALRRLEVESPRHARVVECKFFGGMTIRETSEALGIAPTSVKRSWTLAQAWLHRYLARAGHESEPS